MAADAQRKINVSADHLEQATEIISLVAAYYDVEPGDITRQWSPQGRPAKAMRVAAYLIYKRLPLSHPQVGRIMNKRRTSICRMILAVWRDDELSGDASDIAHEMDWGSRQSASNIAFG